ncbi:hypothetical protein TPY_0426 [Sulfobacillus acidophilus TPY]|uniref:Uncharacterized protein n=1 Tax=Sulfobacillus acidophilus (strain ATCC 700253 / DSM 10332 / NAL) TaxID=679936 RepID=G8TY50_SULAD|nr:hypothetical protein TPY_0426 [Sulfobacillus acidophilus TPY]AEW03957.1 hypothetical protein Sulac_0390 [Sulfobacillus acidophilus DSM 10332]
MEDAETRYRQAAADYLGLPPDHPAVIGAARQAAQAAELAVFDYLRRLRKETDGCVWPYMLASVPAIKSKPRTRS